MAFRNLREQGRILVGKPYRPIVAARTYHGAKLREREKKKEK